MGGGWVVEIRGLKMSLNWKEEFYHVYNSVGY